MLQQYTTDPWPTSPVHLLDTFTNCEKQPLPSSCVFICLSTFNNSAPTWQIITKFDIWVFFENLSLKFRFDLNLTIRTGNLHEDLCIFMILSHQTLLRMRNVSGKSCRENQKTHFVQKVFFNRANYEVMWKNMVEPDRAQVAIMRIKDARMHTYITLNTYCFSTGTTVTLMHLNVTLHVQCPSCTIHMIINCITETSKLSWFLVSNRARNQTYIEIATLAILRKTNF